jgi:hypothetical protein
VAGKDDEVGSRLVQEVFLGHRDDLVLGTSVVDRGGRQPAGCCKLGAHRPLRRWGFGWGRWADVVERSGGLGDGCWAVEAAAAACSVQQCRG